MRFRSESKALVQLTRLRDQLRTSLSEYEQNAVSCDNCSVRGECCRDEHFVNVRVSAIETSAIRRAVSALPEHIQRDVRTRAQIAADKLRASDHLDEMTATYRCPLYDDTLQCLVHTTAKPMACVFHACYPDEAQLPPDELLDDAEMRTDAISRDVYGKSATASAIPFVLE